MVVLSLMSPHSFDISPLLTIRTLVPALTPVKTLGGDEKGQGAYENPDIALDWAVEWVEQNLQNARPKFKGRVS